MIIGATPTHVFELPFSTDVISELHIIYAQDDSVVLTKTKEDCVMNENIIEVTLSQEDTFLIDKTKLIEIQLRVLTTTGTVLGSVPIRDRAIKCLENGVIL
jgi:hypothetical protein